MPHTYKGLGHFFCPFGKCAIECISPILNLTQIQV